MKKATLPLLDFQVIRSAHRRAAPAYAAASEFDRLIADRLIERLEWIRLAPQRILDVGVRTGYTQKCLVERYPGAEVYGADFSFELIQQANSPPSKMVNDYTALPLASNSVDFIFSNLALPWSVDLDQTLKEFQRVLKPEGLLLFTTLGPDTLKELRTSFLEVDDYPHVHAFVDMHDIGDRLLHHRFQDPVMDMEHVTMNYDSVTHLARDIKSVGAQNAWVQRSKSLTGKTKWQRVLSHYENYRTESGDLPATIEIIYGHAWGHPVSSSLQGCRDPDSLDGERQGKIFRIERDS